MGLPDEELALLRRKKRMEEQEEERRRNKPVVTEEEIIEGIQSGEVTLDDKTVLFQPAFILCGRLGIYLPVTSFTEKCNTKEVYQVMDDEMELSIQFALSEEKKGEFEPLSLYQKNMENNLKPSGISFKWMEEGSVLLPFGTIQYLEFINVTGLGVVHNFMLFIKTEFGQIIGNINFNDKDNEFWVPVVKAYMKLISVCKGGVE